MRLALVTLLAHFLVISAFLYLLMRRAVRIDKSAAVVSAERDIDLQRTVERLQRANNQRARLLSHLVTAELEERERIASGIHDDSIQVMTSASMTLDLLLSRWDEKPSLELTTRARELVGDSIRGLRGLVFELKPLELDAAGLETALRVTLERSSSEGGFTFEIDDRLSYEIPEPTRYLFYRILQEAISNVTKHASADNVEVSMEERDGGVFARVSDDGEGIETSQANQDQFHFGLKDMKQRAEAAGGWCRVGRNRDRGTLVEVWFPVARPEFVGQVG